MLTSASIGARLIDEASILNLHLRRKSSVRIPEGFRTLTNPQAR